jgi:hypothetical protein
MTKSRQDSMYLMVLGAIIFVLLGCTLEAVAPHPVSDFRFVYNSARCLFQHVDPYQRSEFLRVFVADGGNLGSGATHDQYLEMAQHMYPPTTFILFPFALLPWQPAIILWTALIAAAFVLAAFLTWDLSAAYAPVPAALLIFLVLASGELLLIIGNAAGLVISLSIIAAYGFIRKRFPVISILCCAASLMIKPHDGGLVWLYFLLAGGVYRKRALQTLAVVVILSLPLVVWVSLVSPHWFPELKFNLAMLSAHGHLNDPGPSSMAGHGIAMVIDLQTVLSLFRDSPAFYNTASYLACGILLAVWIAVTLRARQSPTMTWLALAAVAPLSLLPVYHRLGDAKLLLLTIPACALLWAEGGVTRWLAIAVSGTSILLTGDMQWALFFRALSHLHFLSGKGLVMFQVLPVPLILLASALFYLTIYVKRGLQSSDAGTMELSGVGGGERLENC